MALEAPLGELQSPQYGWSQDIRDERAESKNQAETKIRLRQASSGDRVAKQQVARTADAAKTKQLRT